MLLHGEEVRVGDNVFDVSATRGPGIVSLITRRGMEVRFPSGPMATYNSEGKQLGNSRATLFWHDPIIAVPVKNHAAWLIQKRIGLSVRDAILEAGK